MSSGGDKDQMPAARLLVDVGFEERLELIALTKNVADKLNSISEVAVVDDLAISSQELTKYLSEMEKPSWKFEYEVETVRRYVQKQDTSQQQHQQDPRQGGHDRNREQRQQGIHDGWQHQDPFGEWREEEFLRLKVTKESTFFRVFIRKYFVEIRNLLCNEAGSKKIEDVSGVSIASLSISLTAWTMKTLNVTEPFAYGIATAVLMTVISAAKNTFCSMTSGDFSLEVVQQLQQQTQPPSAHRRRDGRRGNVGE